MIKTDDFSSVFNFRKRIAGKYLVFHYKVSAELKDKYEYKLESNLVQKLSTYQLEADSLVTTKQTDDQHAFAKMKPNQPIVMRVGLAVAKKVAKRAVDRNYMKRVLREFVRIELRQLAMTRPNLMKVDVVIRVQKIYSNQQFIEIQKEFNQLFSGLLRKCH